MLESIKQNVKQKLTSMVKKLREPKDAKLSKNKKKKRKKWSVIVSVFLVLAVCVVWIFSIMTGSGSRQASLFLSDTTVLQYTDLKNSISASGTVESANSTMLYSTLSYTVKAVNINLGDYVEEGQLLAELDDQSIQDQISSQEVSMQSSASSSAEQIKSAQANYDNYKYGLDNGLNSSLNSAENQVQSSYESYEKAVLTYERYRDSLDLGENTTLINAESSLRNAEYTLANAEASLDTADSAYDDARENLYDTDKELEEAYLNLDNLKEKKVGLETQLATLKQQLEANADQSTELQTAKTEKEETIQELQNQVTGLKDEVTPSTNANAENINLYSSTEIANLEQQISQLQTQLTDIGAAIVQVENSSGTELQQQISQLETQIVELETQIAQAETSVASLETAYEQAAAAVESAKTQLDSAERSYENAVASYESQLSSYNASVTSVDQTLADYLTSVETAWETYQDALVSLEVAKKSAEDQLETYENSLSSARTNSSNASGEENLRQLRVDLDSTKITAPTAGTITAIYAEVGSSGSGLLFVIEDINDLVVDTSINDYDMGVVQPGVEVEIRSDATGETEISGILSSVAPTANKNAQGITDTSNASLFAAEVKVTSKETGLKIGMEAQLDFIIEEESHVLSVPYDAVYQNAQGQDCIIAAIEQSDGTYLLKELPVTTGISDDLDIVVSGTDLEEGIRVLNEPDPYRMYIGRTLSVGTAAPSNNTNMMPMGGMMGGGR